MKKLNVIIVYNKDENKILMCKREKEPYKLTPKKDSKKFFMYWINGVKKQSKETPREMVFLVP